MKKDKYYSNSLDSLDKLYNEIDINKKIYKKIKFNNYVKMQKNTMKIRIIRRNIARLKTILNDKLILIKNNK